MYSVLLALHSLLRWLVLVSLLFALYRGYNGWLSNKPFTKVDKIARLTAVNIIHTQLLIGLILYFVSPNVQYLFHNFSEGMQMSAVRFFGMEHIFMMLVAITLITIGSVRSKRKSTDIEKFKTMAIWFTIGIVIILIFIPWPFSPLAARPYFRPF